VEARRVPLDQEAADLALLVARPHDHDVGDRGVADPALLAAEHVAVAVAPRLGLEQHGVGAVVGLGQRERADRRQVGHRRQPALLLLLGAEHLDRLHRQVRVNAEERAHAAVGARPLHAHEARGHGRHARAAVALDRAAGQAELGDLRHQHERELRALPVVVDDREHLGVAERAQRLADPALLGGEQLVHEVEIAHSTALAARSAKPFTASTSPSVPPVSP
jgi:hypothetical protein